tara:strand:- start:5458 stop:6594 length:1137 start_codon:yes stop_codon:yes gene_type:complete
MIIAFLTLFVALAISGVAAWYSIVGLMAIFASAAFAIALMGIVLEVGKLVTASWLYQNWNTSHKLLRGYLTVSVIVLMLITSMGIFGFLSKAHIDQTLIGGDNTLKIELLDTRINEQQRKVDDATKVISQLDSSVQTLIDAQRIRGSSGSISVRESQSVERESLNGIISKASERIITFRESRQDFSKDQLKYEAEVGPIRYIAEFIYSEKANKEMLESAVRWVIILIIFVFDPLAILLLIAANISLSKPKMMRTAVNVKELNEEWTEINVETETPQTEPEPEIVIENENPENTVSFQIIEEETPVEEPVKPKRKRGRPKKNKEQEESKEEPFLTHRGIYISPKHVANTDYSPKVANTDYGSITDIRKKKKRRRVVKKD